MIFYTYLWLREDGTPYYAGKGHGKRAFIKKDHRVRCPNNTEQIIVQEHPSEFDAFEAEKALIAFYGRIDNGTGCLANLTDGGEGQANPSLSVRQKISEINKGNKNSLGHSVSNESRLKMSKAKLGHKFWLGRKHSEETKQKISLAKTRHQIN